MLVHVRGLFEELTDGNNVTNVLHVGQITIYIISILTCRYDIVRDLCSTDPTQETCPRSCRLYGSTMPHELDRIGKDISALKSLDREVAIDLTDHLFKVCIRLVDRVSDSTN